MLQKRFCGCVMPVTNRRAFDSFEKCGFEFNEFGGIRSDFATLVNSQSLLVMQQAAARLQQLRAVEPDNSGKSFDDIIKEVEPRWLDSPKRKLEFEQYLIDNHILSYEEIKSKLEAEEAAKLEDSTPATE